MKRSSALAAAVALFSATTVFAGQMKPINLTNQGTNRDQLQARCQDFVSAVTVYSLILESNPVYGTDRSRKEPFAWASVTADALRPEPSDGTKLTDRNYVQDYLNAFGPVTHPTLVPNMALYQSDKAACLAAFGS